MKHPTRMASAVALGASIALLAAACSGGSDEGSTGEASEGADVTLTWWHNSNNEPGRGFYEQAAADYEADHPGVTIEIQALQHEDMLTKLDAAFQTGDTPDVYMERGGGELADHVEAELTMDLTDVAADAVETVGGSVAGWQVDGRTYALPFSVGVVGFWYNTELFEQAGITEAPTTMDEFDDAVSALRDAGIAPVSVGAGDLWPAAHFWYYFAVRQCAQDVLSEAVTSLDFSDECFLRAGEDLEHLIGTEPFNEGFLATPAQSGPTSASALLATGQVAMELAGHWEPGVMQGLTEDQLGLGENTGWFPFPQVDGGEGDPAATLGGGDAWACSADAPPECVDFISYLLSDDVQIGFAENSMGLPTNQAASGSVADPALADLLTVRDSAPYVQLYLDTAFGENVGGAMNDAIGLMFAGDASPQDIVDAIQSAAGTA
ncbi:extracellular solute-binding protein family 1 [Beutenbergia cavernae DSM 12333]|uniref:Extracellular solute-binding protein family 1 n=1 Tax=Beutenbergia cavernae (strain ATCC BAA-8 / DSM 12333 / CCUG 43141 / JCM 11478 / NBRC 16432 / NCIMB 13614 / HKI 0122) TaxID=471853 RepID=C5BY64_BEUC1|nr:extracellular solute-binding protein [Beutenbergia cavernae]ACQ80964.1 extracellular solute-binding protein family 1 [Beutenbergia cavernae DSM 12333]